MRNFLKILSINRDSVVPMYQQIFSSIKIGVEEGIVDAGDILPSLNDLSIALDISKNTSEKAYRLLIKKGFLGSIKGKGYFIIKPVSRSRKRILLLFNKLSDSKKIIYDSFVQVLNKNATIDLCVYNNDIIELAELIEEKALLYDYFVVIPPHVKNDELLYPIMKKIPAKQLYLLDRQLPCSELFQGAVFQDFKKDIYFSLLSMQSKLKKYERLKIIFPTAAQNSKDIVTGYMKFCRKTSFTSEVIKEVEKEEICKGTIYISLTEEDLMVLIHKIKNTTLQLGIDVGIISYNEAPFKKILMNGITTISTDFHMMGTTLANFIMQESNSRYAVPFTTICRNSI